MIVMKPLNQLAGNKGKYIQDDMKSMCYEFIQLSFPKYFVENISRIYLIVFLTSETWLGDYTLIQHLGALVIMFIFSPQEQISFNLFSLQFSDLYSSKTYQSISSDQQQSKTVHLSSPSQDDNHKKANSEKLNNLITQFSILINQLIIFCGLIIAYGIPYSETVFSFCLGDKWTRSDMLSSLNIYLFLQLILGLNGITESFQISSLKSEDVRTYNCLILLSSVIFLLGLIQFSHQKVFGLFLAEIYSKIYRIIIALAYLKRPSLNINPLDILQKCLPNKFVLLSLIIGYFCADFVNGFYNEDKLKGFCIGIAQGLFHVTFIIVIMKNEINGFKGLLSTYNNK